MTAQASDTLVMDGKSFMVRGYISDPQGVEPPPKDPTVSYSHCWGGYTQRWEVKDVNGEKRLFLLGYNSCGSEVDGYFPLVEPAMNPITEKVKVVPSGSECLDYAHMGFESKFAGERYLVFQWGKLVNIEEISDEEPNQDGILDMAGLHPGGKEKGLEEIKSILYPDINEVEKEPAQKSEKSCCACNTIFISEKDILCPSCGSDLVAVGKSLKNWRCDEEPGYSCVRLFATTKGYRSPLVNPEWHRKSRLWIFADLKYDNGKKLVVLEVSGNKSFTMREKPEAASNDDPLNMVLTDFICNEIEDRKGMEIEARADSYGSRVNVKKEFRVKVPVIVKDGKIDAEFVAGSIENGLDETIERWVDELLEMVPALKKAWKRGMDSLTGGTGIYPYDPSEMTPRDDDIIWDIVYSKMRLDDIRKWAIPPRHTKEGWVPGIKIVDSYLVSLNL